MYLVTKNDETVETVETVTWVYRLSNGDLGLTDRDHATGISIPSGVYAISDDEDMQEFEQVVLNEVDGGALLAEERAAREAVEDAMCEADIANAEWQAEIENALCELDEGV